MTGLYQRDNLSSLLAGSLGDALARHQATTDRQNKLTQANVDAIAKGAEGVAKDIYRDRLLSKLDALKAQRDELDLQEAHDELLKKYGDQTQNDYMGALADDLIEYKVDRDWDALAGKVKPMNRNTGNTYLGEFIRNGGLY